MFESQNKADDDGQVIDSLFIETDAPPDLKAALSVLLQLGEKLKEPAKITRLISRSLSLDPTWGPVLLLPADSLRKELKIRVYSPTAVATDGARFSDEPGDIRTAGRVLHTGTSPFENHTGPVYVIGTGAGTNGAASATVIIEAWSVTE
jgi:hypothetical protein